MGFITYLECCHCLKRYPFQEIQTTCSCGYPLLVRYDLQRIQREFKKELLKEREGTLWRYEELLPVIDRKNIISLGEGFTPIIRMNQMEELFGLDQLFLKNEGQNPTGTFKDRGASVGVSKSKELKIPAVILNSTGNASAAWAAYCAKSDIDLFIILPHDVQESCLVQSWLNRAHILLFEMAIHKLGNVVDHLSITKGLFNGNSFREPYRVEGKKTMGLEVAEMFQWELPDVIVYPTGTGTGIVGMWKAFSELSEIGWISPNKKTRLVIVQLEGCAPYVKAFNENKDQCELWENIREVPGGIRSPKPRCDFMVLDILRKTDGIALAVNLKETISMQREVAAKEGLYICPEGATTFAALKHLIKAGWINKKERVLLFNTGNGLKYIPMIKMPKAPIIKNEEEIPAVW
jgi:threonine synthase